VKVTTWPFTRTWTQRRRRRGSSGICVSRSVTATGSPRPWGWGRDSSTRRDNSTRADLTPVYLSKSSTTPGLPTSRSRVRRTRSANSSTLRRWATSARSSEPEGAFHGYHSTRSGTSPSDAFRRRRGRQIEEFGGRTSAGRQPEGMDCAQVEAIDPSVTSPLCAAKAARTSSFSRAGTPK
jgi:hypothetical protein